MHLLNDNILRILVNKSQQADMLQARKTGKHNKWHYRYVMYFTMHNRWRNIARYVYAYTLCSTYCSVSCLDIAQLCA